MTPSANLPYNILTYLSIYHRVSSSVLDSGGAWAVQSGLVFCTPRFLLQNTACCFSKLIIARRAHCVVSLKNNMFVCLSVRLSVCLSVLSSGLITSVLDIWPGFGRQALRNWVLSVSSEQFEIRFLADSGIGFVYKLIKKKHQIRTFLIQLNRFWTELSGLRNRIRVQTDPKVAPNLMKFYTMCPSGHPCPAGVI